jgi:dephospho-CoA kinase
MPASPDLLRVALTGGIATGKSHCLRWFTQHGVSTIDADQLAREAIGPGSKGLEAVMRRFGSAIVGPYGLVNRAALGRIVFADDAARRDLEAIIHPYVFEAIQKWFEGLRTAGAAGGRPATIAMADIPLLYETSHEQDFDRVVVVACSPATQLARLVARERLSEAEARQRIGTQLPIDEKRARASLVIDTDGSFADTDRQCAAVLANLQG